MRQIVFDLETTGLSAAEGHRIIEIGAVELIRRELTGVEFHRLINPEREVDPEASQVHGYTWESLRDQPVFAEVAEEMLDFLAGSPLVIHNAPFDTAFLTAELDRLEGAGVSRQQAEGEVLDTLQMARDLHPGQRNSLDALIRRYNIVGPDRELHGALKDARLLARVYLAMSIGQERMEFDTSSAQPAQQNARQRQPLPTDRPPIPSVEVSDTEIEADIERWNAIHRARPKIKDEPAQ